MVDSISRNQKPGTHFILTEVICHQVPKVKGPVHIGDMEFAVVVGPARCSDLVELM